MNPPERKCLLCQVTIPGGTGMFLCDAHWKEVPGNFKGFYLEALKQNKKEKAIEVAQLTLRIMREKYPEFKKEN